MPAYTQPAPNRSADRTAARAQARPDRADVPRPGRARRAADVPTVKTSAARPRAALHPAARDGVRLPAASDQDGRPTSLEDARGNVVAMTFIYSSCRDLCPAEGNDRRPTRCEQVGSGVQAYVISVDPIGDTPGAREGVAQPARPSRRHVALPDRHAQAAAAGVAGTTASSRSSPRRRRPEAAMKGSSAFWKQNPLQPGGPKRPYETPPPPTTPPTGRPGLPGHRRPRVPGPRPPRRRLELRALRVRAADRQARRAARRHPVRGARRHLARERHPRVAE